MKKVFILIATLCNVACITAQSQNEFVTETFTTNNGKALTFKMLCHGSIGINYDNCEIQIDPVGKNGDKTVNYNLLPKADVILVTHEHYDHLDSATIQNLCKPTTKLIANKASAPKIKNCLTMANGDEMVIAENIKVKAVPAYNTTPDRQKFHPKGNGNGYLISFDDYVVYIAGDTEDIPEMKNLGKIDIAFLPVNQPYTMAPDQCYNAAKMLNPKVLIPYHLSDTNIEEIAKRFEKESIIVKFYESLQ